MSSKSTSKGKMPVDNRSDLFEFQFTLFTFLASKKRKMGTPDPSQHRLDRFLSLTPTASAPSTPTMKSTSSTEEKDDPMQIDSEPLKQSKTFLGLFRQQSTVPTITIANTNRKEYHYAMLLGSKLRLFFFFF
jgi:hypothetical protein